MLSMVNRRMRMKRLYKGDVGGIAEVESSPGDDARG